MEKYRSELTKRQGMKRILDEQIERLEAESSQLSARASLEEKAAVVLKHCGDASRALLKKGVEAVLDAACRIVYPGLSCSLEFSESRGLVGTTISLRSEGGVVGDPRNDSFGGGVSDLLALAARVAFTAQKSPTKIVVVDEGMKYLGDLAVQGARFLRQCATEMLDQVIMVTHEPRFKQHADAVYTARQTAPDTCVIAEETIDAAEEL